MLQKGTKKQPVKFLDKDTQYLPIWCDQDIEWPSNK